MIRTIILFVVFTIGMSGFVYSQQKGKAGKQKVAVKKTTATNNRNVKTVKTTGTSSETESHLTSKDSVKNKAQELIRTNPKLSRNKTELMKP